MLLAAPYIRLTHYNCFISYRKLRLAQIKLAGFKSFVDPTQIPLSNNLVGIVGPNGCGKSNIIDALRWVLGESKASALRGDSMQDVIFSGSNQRKALGRASVEIVFDNSINKVTGQWASYSEIAIKRILHRDGVSQYYINNLQVRRRDISDLFLGTGVGGKGYAIIEQGMINRIIEAKPQELRSFLEEAAGISQYRERRQETATRLTETRKNLTRLEDICQELDIQLHHLEAQAKLAQQYQQLQQKLQTTQSLLWLQRIQEATKLYDSSNKGINRLENEVNALLNKHEITEAQLDKCREQEHQINEKMLNTQGELYAADAEIGRIDLEINHLQQNKIRLTHQIELIELDLVKCGDLQEKTCLNLVHWTKEKSEAEALLDTHKLTNDRLQIELPDAEADFLQQQDKIATLRNNLLTLKQDNQLQENRTSHAHKNLQQLGIRLSRLQQEMTELPSVDKTQLYTLKVQADDIEKKLFQEQANLEQIGIKLVEATQSKQHISKNLQQLQHAHSEFSARRQALQHLQQKLESNTRLAHWLNQQKLDALPRLWQKIQVTPEWETALEAVLRERLNSIEMSQLEFSNEWRNVIPPGRWAMHEKSTTVSNILTVEPPPVENDKPKLLDHVTTTESQLADLLRDWLQHIYIVTDLETGLTQRTLLQHGETLITSQGHTLTRNSLTFYAPDSQLHGVLGRQQELKQLDKEIGRLNKSISQQSKELENALQLSNKLNQASQQANSSSKQLSQQRHQLQLEFVKLSQLHEQAAHRRLQIDSELHEIEQARATELTLLESANLNIKDNAIQITNLEQAIQQAQSTWDDANRTLNDLRTNLQQSSRQQQETVFHIKTCSNKLTEIEHSLQSLQNELQTLSSRKSNTLRELESLDDSSLIHQLEAARVRRDHTSQILANTKQEAENLANLLRESERTRMTCEQSIYTHRTALNEYQLKAQAAKLTAEQHQAMLQECKVDSAALASQTGKKSINTLQTEINRTQNEIAGLGSVNLAALEELEATHTRKTGLIAQMQDLITAIETLENVIQQIDQETRLRMQQTYDQVNQHLSDIFPIIFAGGRARLELCDGKILDAGLQLTAQPPGKKNSSIHLLSGGEKALTALALIFSLFRLNPAPFCLLDEVDAPLDDVNTNRFCELVKTMSTNTQFVFISHNKITMEIAQQLIGVTMQEQGVSKIVAVEIADAISMGGRVKEQVG